jgi:hypothetical protein
MKPFPLLRHPMHHTHTIETLKSENATQQGVVSQQPCESNM